MTIKDHLFNWFRPKSINGKEMLLGYVLDGEPKTMEDIEKVLKAFDLEPHIELFKPLVRHKIDLELVPSHEDNIQIGQSKMGGKPDMLSTTKWPATRSNKHLSFIGQLNCEELKPFDRDGLLPDQGLISFFYCADQEAWGFNPDDSDKFRVTYTELADNLERAYFPEDLETHSIFQPNELTFHTSLSLPGWNHDSIDGVLSDEETDNYIKASGGSSNQMFGYADCVQGPMELECQLVTHGIYCGNSTGYNDPRRKALEPGKEDWIRLLQIDSEEDHTGMMWGDLGKLYFWIRKQDLKDKKFDKCWCILQGH